MQRRKQKPITIRSDRAVELLRLLTRDGRSQAAVIEEALDRMPRSEEKDAAAFRSELEALIRRIDHPIPSMKEFDAREYDEHGNPR